MEVSKTELKPLDRLQALVSALGPPGQEDEIRAVVDAEWHRLGHEPVADAKGNLVLGNLDACRVLVTAHVDEIALVVQGVTADGELMVSPLGGIHPFKLGEGPVLVLGDGPAVRGALGFGSVHTEDPRSIAVQSKVHPVQWRDASVFTGLSPAQLRQSGIGPGTRVVLHPSRRGLMELGEHVAGHFLDDRADLLAMEIALATLGQLPDGVVFAATASEEVGGEGALWLSQRARPEMIIALELAPQVPDAPIALTSSPVLWVADSYAACSAADIRWVRKVAMRVNVGLQLQALSRGGSDASCAASHGHCARPITLGLPMENSHGYEIMHRDAPASLARLLVGLLEEL